jgi:hypothetical protein
VIVYLDYSIRIDKKEDQHLIPVNYRPSDADPLLFVPDYRPCRHRNLQVITKSCGKKVSRYHCSLLVQTVSVPLCRDCQLVD